MEDTFSPGPYVVAPNEDGSYGCPEFFTFEIKEGSQDLTIAMIVGDIPQIPSKKNATLFAASKSMFDVLVDWCELMSLKWTTPESPHLPLRDARMWKRAINVINQAHGKPPLYSSEETGE